MEKLKKKPARYTSSPSHQSLRPPLLTLCYPASFFVVISLKTTFYTLTTIKKKSHTDNYLKLLSPLEVSFMGGSDAKFLLYFQLLQQCQASSVLPINMLKEQRGDLWFSQEDINQMVSKHGQNCFKNAHNRVQVTKCPLLTFLFYILLYYSCKARGDFFAEFFQERQIVFPYFTLFLQIVQKLQRVLQENPWSHFYLTSDYTFKY